MLHSVNLRDANLDNANLHNEHGPEAAHLVINGLGLRLQIEEQSQVLDPLGSLQHHRRDVSLSNIGVLNLFGIASDLCYLSIFQGKTVFTIIKTNNKIA